MGRPVDLEREGGDGAVEATGLAPRFLAQQKPECIPIPADPGIPKVRPVPAYRLVAFFADRPFGTFTGR